MKIRVIGCGNAFSIENYNQSFLLEENNKTFLIDCGHRIPLALHYSGIDFKKIDNIYISHCHGDHAGGLEEIAFKRYDWLNMPRRYSDTQIPYAPRLYCNELLMDELWIHTLKGGLDSMEGFVSNLETFYETVRLKPNVPFEWEGWTIDMIQQVHVMAGSIIKPTFGLFFSKTGHTSIYFTIDAQYFQPKQVRYFYEKADIVFQDCECTGLDMKKRKFVFNSGVHASFAELAGWESANSMVMTLELRNKIWLSHYQDFVNHKVDFFGNDCDWDQEAEQAGFKGFLKLGQEFEV